MTQNFTQLKLPKAICIKLKVNHSFSSLFIARLRYFRYEVTSWPLTLWHNFFKWNIFLLWYTCVPIMKLICQPVLYSSQEQDIFRYEVTSWPLTLWSQSSTWIIFLLWCIYVPSLKFTCLPVLFIITSTRYFQA